MTPRNRKHDPEAKPLSTLQEKMDAEQETRALEQLQAAIGNRVMQALGPPRELERVQVRPLWEGRYRVNVFVGPDAASATVAHSYFLVTDAGGNIVSSTPALTRRY